MRTFGLSAVGISPSARVTKKTWSNKEPVIQNDLDQEP